MFIVYNTLRHVESESKLIDVNDSAIMQERHYKPQSSLRKVDLKNESCNLKDIWFSKKDFINANHRYHLFCKKSVLKCFVKFTEKHLCQVSFLIKLQVWDLQLYYPFSAWWWQKGHTYLNKPATFIAGLFKYVWPFCYHQAIKG